MALNVYLPSQRHEIVRELLGQRGLAELLANQGITPKGHTDLAEISGPGVNLDIVANRTSSWTFSKWKKNELFGRYQFEQEGVHYRGVFFRPGDVLLANVNLDGNGVYTSLADPKSFSSHSAFFALLESGGKRFPVVIETYEKGVRPIPLNVFLGPRFSSYIEVYRHNDYSPDHAASINQSAREFIQNVRGYNFNSVDPDPTYMSCTAVVRFMHQYANLKPAQNKSKMGHPNIQANLKKLGFTYFDFFAPVDFLLNDCFHCVGYVDNNQVDRLLARELVDHEFRQRFTERELVPEKFPFPAGLNRWGIGHIRRQSLIGKIIGTVEGFDHNSLPKGPDHLLAVIKLAEKQIGKAIKTVRNVLPSVLREMDVLDTQKLIQDPRLRHTIDSSLNLPWLR
ncbi:MAG: YiiX/YebB-like N1pC/P60 family cysteine hydrolase [Arenicellales bacterium]|nr:YiiX/YebB-like N1pC/P60 family cysteine hydrolase [Arenicellales bacterium]